MTTNTIIFDLGAVLIDWHPHHLYKKIFDNEEDMHYFLANICTPEWNEEQDAGRTWEEATNLLLAQYPEHEANIRAYSERWIEMIGGPIEGTVEIFRELKESSLYKIYALTNWSHETFPLMLERYEFLQWFDGIVMSGEEKDRKPFPSFYQLLLDRYQVKPKEAVFIDDNLRNIHAAEQIGIPSVHFTSPEELREKLVERGVF
ncbi:HAD family hydrolase [Botryobacter ruber]|uniref:HAD family hydrolase n=1 Tax=Botryobacter ruber TaxID=2171629 RepID=UPI000E0A94F2|nr:HAD family phosphatase [Botryobacter ruber]